jgi:hypothetical protein
LSKDGHRARRQPVQQGRLIEETYAIDIGSDVVVADKHGACNFNVDGVDVVEQAWCEETADVQDEPDENNHCDGARVGAGARALGAQGGGCILGLESEIAHVRAGRFEYFYIQGSFSTFRITAKTTTPKSIYGAVSL